MAGIALKYLSWKQETISDFSDENISRMYENGFVFTRLGKGVMQETRSARVDLDKFELTSENRRILKKIENVQITKISLPFSGYAWPLGKMAKDFYDIKANGAFSVNKIKEIITTPHNFNILFNLSDIGYAICYQNKDILHYSYPFYDLDKSSKDMGLGMMIRAIVWAKENGLRYVYLGSLQRPSDVYKLQFAGLEWFDGEKWSADMEVVKNILIKKSNE